MYLAVAIDLFSRKVVGGERASHMRDDICLEALQRVVATSSPAPGLIHHTDRESQYASSAQQTALSDVAAVPFMSHKRDRWDNACAELFFGKVEHEFGGKADWADEAEARAAVGSYIHKLHNPVPRHGTPGQVSPVAFENQHRVHQTKAA